MIDIIAYCPIKDDEIWVEGIGEDPSSALHNIMAREGCIEWAQCEAKGWKVVAVRVRSL